MMKDIFKEIKRFVKHFLVLIIFVLIFLGLFILRYVKCVNKAETNDEYMYESPNTERVYGDRRVFDYGDQLTAEQESALETYIHDAEKRTVSDIVIVTLNETLADFADENKPLDTKKVLPEEYVKIYADEFWERNHFGYDAAQVLDGTTATGDGVILVDNIFREPETYKVYTWMGTTGICEDKFSDYMIQSCLDAFYDKVEEDYYTACIQYVDRFVEYMEPYKYHAPSFFHIFPCIVALIIFLGYFFTKREYDKPVSMVKYDTYLVGDPKLTMVKEDILLSKNVSQTVHVVRSSSSGSGYSGGGGHHVSRSGGSHGGGGRSR